MFSFYVSLATATILCSINYADTIRRQGDQELLQTQITSEEEEVEIQQKAPLVDIVFTNGQKRTCTGTIIHENVIVTAGHCFTNAAQGSPNLQPELTTSFVVIGTQKKFKAGYEQYLPIEKVILHPNKRGWSADLALVTTFASMTSDKVGAIMPLADEKTYMVIENNTNNMTIMSWGPILKEKHDGKRQSMEENSRDDETHSCDFGSCVSDQRMSDSDDQEEKERDNNNNNNDDDNNEKHTQINKNPSTQMKNFNKAKKSSAFKEENFGTIPELLRALTQTKPIQEMVKAKYVRAKLKPTTRKMSRYLSTYLKRVNPLSQNWHDKVIHNATYGSDLEDYILVKIIFNKENLSSLVSTHLKANLTTQDYIFEKSQRALVHTPRINIHGQKPRRYQNWRRQLGGQQVNKMTVENFRFVNSYACKKMIEKVSLWNEIPSTDEIICYTSDSNYVSDADSGAPAIYQGQLLAITVGGIDSEGDRVGVAVSIRHFCPWIAENLPAFGTQIKCSNSNNEDKEAYKSNRPKRRPEGSEWMISAEYE